MRGKVFQKRNDKFFNNKVDLDSKEKRISNIEETDNEEDSGGTASDIQLEQVTKLGVTATKYIQLPIEQTTTFNRLPLEVLKLKERSLDYYYDSSNEEIVFKYTLNSDDEVTADYTYNDGGTSVEGEKLTTSDEKNYSFENSSIDEGSIVIYKNGQDITSRENVVRTIVDFDNSDKDDFEPNEFIEFDGTMNLKTSYEKDMNDQGTLGEGKMWSQEIDLSKYKKINSISVI